MTERARSDELAELVCVMYGWTAATHKPTERQKALRQLWSQWVRERGEYTPRDYPQLDDAAIARLATERDEVVERTVGLIAQVVGGDDD